MDSNRHDRKAAEVVAEVVAEAADNNGDRHDNTAEAEGVAADNSVLCDCSNDNRADVPSLCDRGVRFRFRAQEYICL